VSVLPIALMALVLAVGIPSILVECASQPLKPPSEKSIPSPDEITQKWMVEGERTYRTNCGRCHQPPHKFAPRAMAMIVRHMRVRAMLTDDEMKYVLYYMTH
jgi:cytochrome c5